MNNKKMCFGGWEKSRQKKNKKKKKIYKFGGNKIWRMANIFKFGGNIIWRTPEKRKFWRELNLADFYQIRQFRQIFFPPIFLPLSRSSLCLVHQYILRPFSVNIHFLLDNITGDTSKEFSFR